MLDERIDKLGKYFVHFKVRERFNITFERFIELVDNGRWKEFIA